MGDVVYGQSFEGIKHVQNHLLDYPPVVDAHGGTIWPHATGTRHHECIQILLDSVRFQVPPALAPIYWAFHTLIPRWVKARNEMWELARTRLAASRIRAEKLREAQLPMDSAQCILDMIVEREGKEEAKPLTDVEIRGELMGFLV